MACAPEGGQVVLKTSQSFFCESAKEGPKFDRLRDRAQVLKSLAEGDMQVLTKEWEASPARDFAAEEAHAHDVRFVGIAAANAARLAVQGDAFPDQPRPRQCTLPWLHHPHGRRSSAVAGCAPVRHDGQRQCSDA